MKTERTDTAFSVDTPPPGGLRNNQDTFWGAFLSWEIFWEPFRAIAFNPHPITKVDVSTILRLKKMQIGNYWLAWGQELHENRTRPCSVGVGSQTTVSPHTHTLNCFSTQLLSCRSWLSLILMWSPVHRHTGGVRRQQPLWRSLGSSASAFLPVLVNSGLILHMGSIAAESHSPHLSSLKSFFLKKKMGRNEFFLKEERLRKRSRR